MIKKQRFVVLVPSTDDDNLILPSNSDRFNTVQTTTMILEKATGNLCASLASNIMTGR